MARGSQARVEDEQSAWVLAHRALSRLAAERARADVEEGRCLLAALRARAHVHAGFGSFVEYVGHLFGYGARLTHEKLRVAEALEGLPLLEAALESAAVCWSTVRELTRVATVETESEWLAAARGQNARQVEALVSGAAPGSSPRDARDPAARRHVLRFEVAADTFALVREALAQLSQTAGSRLDDDAALLAMARAVLGGPGSGDEGRASYQIGLSVCARCGAGEQPAGGQVVRVDPEVVAMARCDAEELGWVGVAENENAGGSAPTRGLASDPSSHELEPKPEKPAHVGSSVSRSIPRAVRRRVLHRDHRCCSVPGCGNTRFVDLHHLIPRSEGGKHTADVLITLCGVHHRAVHRGELVIEGTAAHEVRFLHADGSPYGAVLDPAASDAQAKVFSALRNLGFREKEVRTVLGALREDATTQQLETGPLLRLALERLGPPARI